MNEEVHNQREEAERHIASRFKHNAQMEFQFELDVAKISNSIN